MPMNTKYHLPSKKSVNWIYFFAPILITLTFYLLQFLIKDDFKNEELKNIYGILVLACTSMISAIIALYNRQSGIEDKINEILKISNRQFEIAKTNHRDINASITTAKSLINVLGKEIRNGSKKVNLRLDDFTHTKFCLLYTSPSPRDATLSRMPSSA